MQKGPKGEQRPAETHSCAIMVAKIATGEIDETLTIERLSEEHATVRVTGETRLEPGDRVRVVPNHSCVVSNLVDVVRLVDGDQVIETLPVAARGRIQ